MKISYAIIASLLIIASCSAGEAPQASANEVKAEATVADTKEAVANPPVKVEPQAPTTEKKDEPKAPATEKKDEPKAPATEKKDEPKSTETDKAKDQVPAPTAPATAATTAVAAEAKAEAVQSGASSIKETHIIALGAAAALFFMAFSGF